MILLEGSDCVGKTTLALELFKRIPKETGRVPMMRHFTKLPSEFDRYWGYASCVQRDVIMDRFHMSGIAYPIMYGDTHDLTPFKYSLVDADITRVGGIVVVISPLNHIIEDRWSKMPADRQEMYTLKQVLKVNEIFSDLVTSGSVTTNLGTYWPKIDLAFTDGESTEEMADEIIKLWSANQFMLSNIARSKPASL